MKLIINVSLLFFTLGVCAQQSHIVVDSVTMLPIEFANAVILKYKKGVSSNNKGELYLNAINLNDNDTIAITHINYNARLITLKEFKKRDSIFLFPKTNNLSAVVVKNEVNLEDYKVRNTFGFFHYKRENGITGSGLRSGDQIGLKIENKDSLKGIISNIRLFFEQLAPNAKFRLRLKKINADGSIGDDLLKNGIVFTPKNRRPSIKIKNHRIFFPANGVFVCIDHLGDDNVYSMKLDEPLSTLKLTSRHSKPLTYNNYRETEWLLFHFTYRGKSSNAQIQATVLSKK